jgi:hypothetical protein
VSGVKGISLIRPVMQEHGSCSLERGCLRRWRDYLETNSRREINSGYAANSFFSGGTLLYEA